MSHRGMTLHPSDPLRPQDDTSREHRFPFSQQRAYVRTITDAVGYLSRNDRGSCRGVPGLLDGCESHRSPSPLQSLTWEEARVWWLALQHEGMHYSKHSM